MKLMTKPEIITNVFGGTAVGDAYIWSPSDDAGRVFEKLRVGYEHGEMRIGKRFNHIVFKSDGITLYDVQAVESFNNDTYRCTVDRFGFHDKEEK